MIVLAALVLGSFQNPSDSYGRFVERLAHAQTLEGRSGGMRFWFKRPNLLRVEERDEAGKLFSLYVGDGKHDCIYDAIRNTLGQQLSAPTGFLWHFRLFEPFLDGTGPLWNEGPEPPTRVVQGGRDVDRYKLKPTKGTAGTVMDLDMDAKTELPIRFTIDRPGAARKVIESFEDLKLDSTIDPSIFTYVPQVQANSTDVTSGMLGIGTKAPDFTGRLLVGGGQFRLSTLLKRSKAVILDFWLVGCGPCRDELKDLADLRKRYGAKGLEVVSVGLNDETRIKEFLGDFSTLVPVVVGTTCAPDPTFTFKATMTPTTYLLDSKGIVRGRYADTEMAPIKKDLARLGIGG
ncbi:MAG: redoxin domain-containing protein [Fimbriimonas sp.]|nr:redoxin domain-containing protein [Fimbriimonas sp.]